MKLRIISDIHLEWNPGWRWRPAGEDAVLCAGDMANKNAWDRFEQVVAACDVPFYFTPGNHDSYGSDLVTMLDHFRMMESRLPHFRCLWNETVELDGYALAGTPLWTDFLLYGEDFQQAAIDEAERSVQDFNYEIMARRDKPDWFGRDLERMHPYHYINMHAGARAFLREVVARRERTIVMTHWLPTVRAIDATYGRNAINAYYASNCEELFGSNVCLWVHGHSHTPLDLEVNGTRLLRNPMGSLRRKTPENVGWREDLVVELP